MNYDQAVELTGGLSKPSKMPSTSYSIPASLCKTGGKLRNVKNSVCEKCYALKGFYRMPNVKKALENRVKKIYNKEWPNAISFLLKVHSNKFHRWHDSGDIQDVTHLKQIVSVCKKTKDVIHWLPTREYNFVKQFKKVAKVPKNLVIRLSSHMVNHRLETNDLNSMVVTKDNIANLDKGVFVCPSSKQGNMCLDCRACWDKNVKTVAYIKH